MYSSNASKYHRQLGKILTSSEQFKHHKIVQEYPVQKVNPNWYSSRHRFDWVILDLYLVIEVHGEQHHQAVQWSNEISPKEAKARLEANQMNDFHKKDAAVSAGWRYLAIQYWEVSSLTAQKLLSVIHSLELPTITKTKQTETEFQVKMKERARQYRKKQYRRLKSWKKKINEESDEP